MPSNDTKRRSITAATALAPVLRRQVADLRARESDVHDRAPDAIHDFRVACRRLRATLDGFEPLLDAPSSRGLSRDLRRVARAVAPARDAQAVRAHLDAVVPADADAVVTRLHGRLALLLDEHEVAGWHQAVKHLDDPAYDDLTRRLERFADLPPWQPQAHRPADAVLRPLLRHEWSRFRHAARTIRDARSAGSAATVSAADERLHAVRKASKRARHVAESTTGAFGRKARRLAGAAEAVQEALGEGQDQVLVRTFLDTAHELLTLDADERRAIALLREASLRAVDTDWKDVRRALDEVDRKSLRAWLR